MPARSHLSPTTIAESSGFLRTSLHADVMAFVEALRGRNDRRLAVETAGSSPEGRDLPLLVLSSEGVRTPESAHALERPVVLTVGGIHAGEVEGKEALLALVRDLLDGRDAGLLERITWVVLPLFNPDGNDRIDPANRVLDLAHHEGQDGPASGVGTRVTSAGINLNRDYMRQDSAEMRLFASRVYGRWRPHLTVDTHSTNGSVHRYALTYDSPHTVESGPPSPSRTCASSCCPRCARACGSARGSRLLVRQLRRGRGGRGEGWMTYTHHPRFGSHYRGLTGRLDILAETYSYLPFEPRVRTSYEFVSEVLRLAAERGGAMRDVVARGQAPPARIAVRYALEAFPDPVEILTCEPRVPNGKPVTVRIPHLADFRGTVLVDRPWAYAVPEPIARKLEGHGLRVTRLENDREARIEAGTVEGFAPIPSRTILETTSLGEKELLAEYRAATRRLPAGTALVETEQPCGRCRRLPVRSAQRRRRARLRLDRRAEAWGRVPDRQGRRSPSSETGRNSSRYG
jgi:hypothetical protein